MKYSPKKVTSGDLRVPVRFFAKQESNGPIPGGKERVEVFFAMCEVYDSSTKDLERVSTTEARYTVTINIRHPHQSYRIDHSHSFEIQDSLYSGISFEINHFTPTTDDKEMLKIVGVASGN